MTPSKLTYLNAMGIDCFQLNTAYSTNCLQNQAVHSEKPANKNDNWSFLEQKVAACHACGLAHTRTQTVFGAGNKNAKLLIVGEAPGFHEDREGEPFVGRAGKLLTDMLAAIGLSRKQIYITNILKCHPPGNRDPSSEEMQSCIPFLEEQITLVQPVLLLALGRIAAHLLLKTKANLNVLRQKVHDYGEKNTPLIVTYHPAYLLRNPIDKRNAWLDLMLTAETLKKSALP